jgi:D-alanyl-D-alanine carboxypeptidase (penicillin-binding protein 5/6)
VAKAQSLQLNWPTDGQAAIAADGYDMLATYGGDTPIATASIAKVITALCVLEKYPLKVGESGPTITFSKQDAAFYQYQLQHDGSSIPVYDGSTMTEYEALEALLIPSANNVADSLASWAFGSLDAYTMYANAYVAQHGLVKTHIGIDASGLDPSTVSTAADLARLGMIARQVPVLMSIAGKTSVTLPNAGIVNNYNKALGVEGINGLKTGNNDQNHGGILFTADLLISGKTVQISGAVMSQTNLAVASNAAIQLVGSIAANFEFYTYVHKDQQLGTVTTAWGNTLPVVADSNAQLLRWKGSSVTHKQTIHVTSASAPGSIGALDVAASQTQTSITLKLNSPAAGPSYWWRATRL